MKKFPELDKDSVEYKLSFLETENHIFLGNDYDERT